MATPTTQTTKRAPGRPAMKPERRCSVRLHVRLSEKQYDDACARAHAARVSLSEFVRRSMK